MVLGYAAVHAFATFFHAQLSNARSILTFAYITAMILNKAVIINVAKMHVF
jgi:hypothetical protein